MEFSRSFSNATLSYACLFPLTYLSRFYVSDVKFPSSFVLFSVFFQRTCFSKSIILATKANLNKKIYGIILRFSKSHKINE